MKLGFLSDAHGNVMAFMQAIDILHKHEVEKIYFLGDAIGYFDSTEIIYFLKKNPNIFSIKGNHEAMVLNKSVPDEKEPYYRLKQHYDGPIVPIINSWPDYHQLKIEEKVIHMIHGSIEDPIWGYTHENIVFEKENTLNYDLLVCGATHRPFIKIFQDKIVANVGSCGFPRDIGTEGSCGIYDTQKNMFEIIRFDISESIQYLKATHLDLKESIYSIWERKCQKQ